VNLPLLDQQNGTCAPARHAEAVHERAQPHRIVAWALERFANWRIVVTTGFGMEGCALIDMIARTGYALDVTYLDTHFFFPETHDLRERLAQCYPRIGFVNAGSSLTPEQQAEQYGPQLWRCDPDTCCRLRKVEPMRRLLSDADVWMTGIRRDQSPARANTRTIEWDWQFNVLKISPLAYWTRSDVWSYIRQHNVPYNELHDRGYPSIGCTHCTEPIPGATITDYSRDGRWSGTGKTECGLHAGEGI